MKNMNPSSISRVIKHILLAGTILIFAFLAGVASAHNLDASAVYVFLDPDTRELLDTRIEDPSWIPPEPLLQVGDEMGMIIKVVPDNGTTTGVGGYSTFYVPNGVTVIDAAFVVPGSDDTDGLKGYDKIAAHGQAAMPSVGAGGDSTVSLVGYSRGPNILGVTSTMVDAGNANLGTLPGVYGDIGIFYSTAPETAFATYPGSKDPVTGEITNSLSNNSGDDVGKRTVLGTPLNLWDVWQMAAYGISGADNDSVSLPQSPILDSNGRGYAPWGLASAVAGPESGYAWQFDLEEYRACSLDKAAGSLEPAPQCLDAATDDTGPWKRIRHAGSTIADDPPGASPDEQPYVSGTGTDLGVDLSVTDLPSTVSQSDGVSPNAIRWALGQLTYLSPEYVWIKLRIDNPAELLGTTGCPIWWVDTFGGDAGGDSGGKDHIWRYYDPNSVILNGCVAVGKTSDREVVRSGDNFQYRIKYYNAGSQDLFNVTIRETLPSGVDFLSAIPAQGSGPNPLIWNLGTMLRGQKFEALVTVDAVSSGALSNEICIEGEDSGGGTYDSCSYEITPSGNIPYLIQTKSVSPTSIAPGGVVEYTIRIDNIGAGESGNPFTITEDLPDGFTYDALISVTVNGADLTASTSVDATNTSAPVFVVPSGVLPEYSLFLTFAANVAASNEPGLYCNSFTGSQGGINNTTGAIACVNVGGGKIGGNIFHDWLGDGTADAGDEGVTGLPVELYQCVDGCGGTDDILLKSTATDADGNYLFEGLAPDAAGTDYRIVVDDGTGSPVDGYTQTAEPPGAGCSGSCDNIYDVNLTEAANESLSNDFGYQPAGSGAIGDLVYQTIADDGDFDSGTDGVLAGVKVFLYEDSNGNGAIDPDDQKIAEDTTDGSGLYGFTSLAKGLDYIVFVPRTDNAALSGHFDPESYRISTGLDNPLSVPNLTGTVDTADFGFFEVTASNLGGRAYQEEDGVDGFTGTDVPIPNVTVYLRDSNGTIIDTTTTDTNGLYVFTDVVGGNDYTVDIVQEDPDVPTAYSPSRDNISVTVPESTDIFDIDFPFTQLLSKTANVSNPSPGDTITYTVTPNYTGENLLTNVTVTDPIPDGTTYVDDSAGQGGFIGTGSAGPITIEVSRDTYLNQSDADRNFGSCTTLSTGKDPNNVKHALLAFDLSEIPSTATITSAKLYMQKSGGDDDIFPETVHRVAADWDAGGNCNANDVPNESNWTERQATNVAWGTAGGDYAATVEGETSVGAVGLYNWTITSLVQEWVDGSATNYGLLVKRKDGNTVNKEHIYDTRDGTGVVPYLEISYTNGVAGEVTWSLGSNSAALDGSTGGTDTSTFSAPPLSDNLDSGRDTGSGPVDNNDRLTSAANITPDSIATDSSGNLHVVFNQNGANTYYTSSIDGGATWSAPLQINVSADGKDTQAAIAVDSNDVIHVVAVDEDKNIFYRSSTNGGTSFSGPVEIGNSVGSDGTDQDPDIAVDGSDNLHVTFNQNNANTFYVKGTFSAGPTWSWGTPLQIDGSGDGKDRASQVAVDGSNVYVVIDDENKNILLRKSTDGGGSFAAVVEIDGTAGDGTDRYPDIAADPSNGDLHVVFNRNGASTHYIKSTDAGANWTAPLGITSTSGSDKNAAIAVDRFGFVHVAIDQNNRSIFYQYSTDGGDNFIGETEIDTAVGDNTDRYPAIAVSSDAVHVVFEQNGNHVYYNGADILAPTTSTMSAAGTLVSSGNSVTVTLTFGAEIAVTGVTPANFTATGAGGASAGTCTGPTPASGDITAGGTIDFSWSCPLNAGTEVGGSVTFSADAAGSNGGDTISFATTTSNSVLVTPPLTFQVTVDDVGGQIDIDNTATINEDGTTVDGEDSNTVITPVRALIGDTVFIDWDQDGIQDAGEPGISGVTVELDNGACTPLPDGAADCPTTTTNVSGFYSFVNLAQGNYTVNVISSSLPAGYTPVSDYDGVGTPNTTGLTLGESEANYDVDFGYRPTGSSSIGDTVFEDSNNDNIYNGNDKPLANITVNLYFDTNGDGMLDAGDLLYGSTGSDFNGEYLFENLPDADFIVAADTEDPNIATGLEAQITEFAVDTDGTSSYLNNDFPFEGALPAIYKWVDKTTVDQTGTVAERTVTYALGINFSGGLLNNIKVTDEIPEGTAYVAASANLSGAETDGVLEWNLGGNDAGTPGLYVENKELYAFRGDDKQDFWKIDVGATTPAWDLTPTNTPTGFTVMEGGALTVLDGIIYGLRGDGTSSIAEYDPDTGTNGAWNTLGSTPAVAKKGGSLTNDGTYLYAFAGNQTAGFWRYDVTLDQWDDAAVADLPGGEDVDEGGALVFDGTNIYALQGNSVNFWRYNIASDTWTARAEFCDTGSGGFTAKEGGALAFDGTYIYAMGNNKQDDFCRYDPNADEWLALADVPEGVEQGGALAFAGTDIWATAGNGTGFYSYDIGLNTWTASTSTPENVKWGGALAFLPSGNQTTTTIRTTPSAFSCDANSVTTETADNCPYTVVVTMTVTNNGDTTLTNVQGGTLTTANVGAGTATVTYVSGPDVTGGVSIAAGASQVFTYEYNVTADTTDVSEITFEGSAFDGATEPFATATSPSTVVTPALTFQVVVDSGATVDPVVNLGTLSASNIVKLGPDACYAVADETDPDTLVSVGRLSPYDVVDIGDTGTTHIESLVWSPDKTVLYTTDRWPGASGSDHFGTLDPDTGVFTGYGNRLGTLRIPALGITDSTLDVDAMSFDPANGRLYAVNRREGSTTQLDILFQIDPVTGTVIQNAFGAGADGIPIATNTLSTSLYDVDGLAFDLLSGVLYGMANTSATGSGINDHLVIINRSSGAVTDIGRLTEGAGDFVDDMEGISMFDDGTLYGVTGDGAATDDQNSFWVLNKATGGVTWLSQFPNHSDYESIACLDGPTDETVGLPPTSSNPVETYLSANIGDFIWNDIDGDGNQDGNEPRIAGVQVCATNSGTPMITVCDITDSDGAYRLAGLNTSTYPGDWTVTVTADTAPDDLYPTTPSSVVVTQSTLESNLEYLDADFGYTLVNNPSSIGDRVWVDADEDGVQDPGEDGLEGVTVVLIDCGSDNTCGNTDDFTAQSTTTDANGNYLFGGLPTIAGTGKNYRVKVDDTASVQLPDGGSAILGDAADLVSLVDSPVSSGTPATIDVNVDPAGEDVTDADFGYNWTGSIGDLSWYDKDGDGIQDGPTDPSLCDNGDPIHECGAPNTTVQIRIDTNGDGRPQAGEPILAVQVTSDGTQDVDGDGTTDPVGYYNFTNLPPGNYIIIAGEQEVPAPDSSPNAGEIGTMIATTDTFVAVTLAAGEVRTDVDFGFKEAAILEGTLFHDVNANGLIDRGEPGIVGDGTATAGVAVTLTGFDINGNPVSETTYTDENGDYEFIVDPGNYTISYSTSDPNLPSNLTTQTTPTSISLEVGAGEERKNLDFGIDDSGAIGDRIWSDVDGDGIQDTGEPGIAGVTVQLFESDGTTLVATVATDANGDYDFIGLEDGDYVVQVADSNFDAGGPLAGRDQTGAPSDPAGTTTEAGKCGTTGFEACDSTAAATITGGNQDETIDFAYQLTDVTTYSVSGNIWDDNGGTGGTAGDGIKDTGEPDLEGVAVIVEVDTDNDGVVDDSYRVFTDSNGNYGVSGIPAGSKVTITVDDSSLPGTAFVQSGDPDTTLDNQTVITELTGNVTGQDFAYYEILGSIAGTVCEGTGDGACGTVDLVDLTIPYGVAGTGLDLDDDGSITEADNGSYAGYPVIGGFIDINGDRVIDSNDDGTVNGFTITDGAFPESEISAPETVLGGISVFLTGSGPDGILGTSDDTFDTVTTDSNGDYGFDDLRPGIYQVTKATPGGYSSLADADGGNANNITILLDSGDDVADQDFEVESQVGAIGDLVWHDVDGDGVQDIGEPGIANVALNLYVDADGDGQFEPGMSVVNGLVDANGDGIIDFQDDNYDLTVYNGTTDVVVDIIDGKVYAAGGALYTGTLNGFDVENGVIDLDNDGTHGATDGSDTGFLAGDDGLPLGSQITDINGTYLFTDAASGPYFVDVVDGTLPVGVELSPGGADALLFTLGAGESFLDADFGYNNADTASATIGDTVWIDHDPDGPGVLEPNGIQDPGEAGAENITVTIYYDSDGNGVIEPGTDTSYLGAVDQNGVTGTGTTTTGVDGTYQFSNLAPGDYLVQITVPSGYTVTDGEHSPGSDTSVPITVAADESNFNADFGLENGALLAITDTLWYDDNGDGFKHGAESGIAGVTVNLLNSAGEVIATVITDEQGEFEFTGLPDGNYTIEVADNTGQLDGLGGTTAGGVNGELAVTLSGADFAGVDFGYNRRGAIGDTVFSDNSNDGIQDPGEPGIAGVAVELYYDSNDSGDLDAGDLLIGTQVTDLSGNYLFTNLLDGAYFASVDDGQTALTGYSPTTSDDDAAAGTQIEVVLDGANGGDIINLDADFGYRNTALADVSGNVFEDFDADGVDDGAVDPGIAGVTIDLIDPGEDGWVGPNPGADGVLGTPDDLPSDDTLVGTTTTDANGDYVFTSVAGGPGAGEDRDYVVVVSDSADLLDGYFLTSGLDQIPITVTGDDITDIDYGYIRESGTASIGDTVWLDSNGDGIVNVDETGLAGAALDLYDAGPDGLEGTADDAYVTSTITDANGQYVFDALQAGNYYVDLDETTIDSGLSATTGTGDTSGIINLSEGEFFTEADFGYASASVTVGDFVWYDANANGLQDPGEIGIGGVTVNICARDVVCTVAGGNILGTATTAPDGAYMIDGIPWGDYTVHVDVSTLPSGYSTTLATGDTLNIAIASTDILYADFGYDGTAATIGDTVFQDFNNDGDADAGEGLANVTVDLYSDPNGDGDPSDGALIATVTSDINGNYSFAGLPDGNFVVDVSDLNGVLSALNSSVDPDGTSDGSTTVVVSSGVVSTLGGTSCVSNCDNDVDFGYVASSGTTGTVGDTVWHDIDGDGVYEPLGNDGIAGTADDESGFESVTLDLWLDVNGDGDIDPGIDNFLRSTATDVNGNYTFNSLPTGNYIVDLTDEAGVLDENRNGTIDGDEWNQTTGTVDPAPVGLTSGNPDNFDVDFGFQAVSPHSISGTVFNDSNANGGYDELTELGVEGSLVYLYRVLDNGELALVGTQISDGDGDYLFADLADGDYLVLTDPAGTVVAGVPATTPDTISLTLAGADSTDNDFGFGIEPTPVTIESFSAYFNSGDAIVRWETSLEIGTLGFHVERFDSNLEEFVRLNPQMLPSLFTSINGAVYHFVDESAKNGEKYIYRLLEVDNENSEKRYGPWEVKITGKGRKVDRGFESAVREEDALTVKRFAAAATGTKGGSGIRKPPSGSGKTLKVLVREDGLYRVTAAELATGLGQDESVVNDWIKNDQLLLSHRGERVAGAGTPDDGALLFYGEAIDSVFTYDNAYWIAKRGGETMPVVSGGSPAAETDLVDYSSSSRAEVDLFPITILGGDADSDFFYWSVLGVFGSGKHGYSPMLPLDSVGAADSGTACLTVKLQGYNNDPTVNPDHTVWFRINGIDVGEEESWEGIAPYPYSACFDQDVLLDGSNNVQVAGRTALGQASSIVLIDSYELSYRRIYRADEDRIWVSGDGNPVITVDGFTLEDIEVFDVTNPLRPAMVKDLNIEPSVAGFRVSFEPASPGSTYMVQTTAMRLAPREIIPVGENNLKAANNRADHLVITPSSTEFFEFEERAQDLSDYRTGTGLKSMVVPLEDIYDAFNGGIVNPHAIQDFLAYAMENWKRAPIYVALAGKGSLDHKNIQGKGGNLLPVLLSNTPWGLFACDSCYGDLDDDGVSDISIGRIPILSDDEMEGYVTKLEVYESTLSPWADDLLFSADNVPDIAGNFILDSDNLAELVQDDYVVFKSYLGPKTATQVHDDLVAGFGNKGFVNWVGHGSYPSLAHEKVLVLDDVNSMNNRNNTDLALFAALTCSAGRFEVPGGQSLSEALVLRYGGGAIAAYSPTGLSINEEAVELNEGLLKSIYLEGQSRIGDAALGAQRYYRDMGDAQWRFMLDIYGVTGDPATMLHWSPARRIIDSSR